MRAGEDAVGAPRHACEPAAASPFRGLRPIERQGPGRRDAPRHEMKRPGRGKSPRMDDVDLLIAHYPGETAAVAPQGERVSARSCKRHPHATAGLEIPDMPASIRGDE